MAYCGNCGTENRPGARFCRMCGSLMPFDEAESAPVEPAFPPQPAGAAQEEPGLSERIEQSVLPAASSAAAEFLEAPPVEAAGATAGAETEAEAAGELAAPEALSFEPPGWEPAVPQESPASWADASAVDASAGAAAPEPAAEPPLAGESPAAASAPLAEPPVEEPAPPLAEGTLVLGRYRAGILMETRPDGERVYQAEDMQVCWSCAAEQLQPGLRFCEACGAVLSQWPQVALVETPADGSAPQYHAEPLVEPAPAQPPAFIHLAVGQQTHPGMQRLVNEDSLLVFQVNALCESRPAPQVCLFAVADGIGGSDAGEVASRTAVRAMADAFTRMVLQPLLVGEVLLVESLGEHLKEIVRQANTLILEKRKEKGLDMGATLTALLLYGEDGVIANVGDSRTYLFREGKLSQVTTDHSVVASLVAGGLIKPEEVYFHEQRNVILRSLGDKPELEVDIFPVQAQPGDRFVLCCDGLWEMVRGSMIEDVLLEQPDPQAAASRLVQYANQAGGDDNISVIVVDIHSL